MSCFIGFVLPILGNLIWTKEKTNRKLIQNEGTLTEILLDRAMRTSRTVMITLKSGKVYVGFPLSLPSPGRAQQVIQILQTLSGYREADKHRVVFTTNYSKALNEIHSDCDELTLEIYAKEGERKSIEQQIGTTEKSLVEEQEQLVVDRNSIRLIPPDKVKASRLQELEKQENAIAEKHKTIEEWRAKVRDLRDEVSSLEYQSRRLLSSVEDFGVLIPVDQIASMTLYHASIHTKYFAHIDAAPGEIQHSLPKKP
ncbi:MAG TPA: hypothetical protein VGN86_17275 [Pyrinomonadaceae bacterium]|nr:hypothetical protein [Pyrinomonadaceae bacterium]